MRCSDKRYIILSKIEFVFGNIKTCPFLSVDYIILQFDKPLLSYLHAEHPVYAGGRAVGRSVGRSADWGGEEIWSLRMRAGKKPCGSAAAARARVCVCVCVYQSTDTPSFKIAADAPTKSTHTAAARVIGRVRFFISLSSLLLF